MTPEQDLLFVKSMLLSVCAILVLGADRTGNYDFREKVLPNGLRVVSLEDFTCPIVAVQVWYHVGSKDEAQDRQGFAHMFEHMMFRGTDRLGPKDHFELIRKSGGDCNAYTNFDNTAPPFPVAETTRIYLVDRPGSYQSEIRVGHLGITRKHPDYSRGKVLDQVFGGSFTSRLNSTLRVKKGLTYGIHGGFSARM
jgi:predicted Zn-dependent peptidase